MIDNIISKTRGNMLGNSSVDRTIKRYGGKDGNIPQETIVEPRVSAAPQEWESTLGVDEHGNSTRISQLFIKWVEIYGGSFTYLGKTAEETTAMYNHWDKYTKFMSNQEFADCLEWSQKDLKFDTFAPNPIQFAGQLHHALLTNIPSADECFSAFIYDQYLFHPLVSHTADKFIGDFLKQARQNVAIMSFARAFKAEKENYINLKKMTPCKKHRDWIRSEPTPTPLTPIYKSKHILHAAKAGTWDLHPIVFHIATKLGKRYLRYASADALAQVFPTLYKDACKKYRTGEPMPKPDPDFYQAVNTIVKRMPTQEELEESPYGDN